MIAAVIILILLLPIVVVGSYLLIRLVNAHIGARNEMIASNKAQREHAEATNAMRQAREWALLQRELASKELSPAPAPEPEKLTPDLMNELEYLTMLRNRARKP